MLSTTEMPSRVASTQGHKQRKDGALAIPFYHTLAGHAALDEMSTLPEVIELEGRQIPRRIILQAAREYFDFEHWREITDFCKDCDAYMHYSATWYEPGASMAGEPEENECSDVGDFEPFHPSCRRHAQMLEIDRIAELAVQYFDEEMEDLR